MSLCAVSWRKVKRLNRELSETFVSAAAHHDGRSWLCTRYDGSTVWVDVRTGEVGPGEDTTTGSLLRTRVPDWPGDEAWLAELDRRHAEMAEAGDG